MSLIEFWFKKLLMQGGFSEQDAALWNMIILLIGLIILVGILDYLLWKFIRVTTIRIARRTKTNFDNLAIQNRLPRYLAHIFPLILLIEFTPLVFFDFPYAANIAQRILNTLVVVLSLNIVRRFLKTIADYLKTKSGYKDKPIDSYVQVFMMVAWTGGLFTILAVITEIDLWKFFAGLGAASAVLLLIFKDSILGFVASIQVSVNDIVRIGDWITFEKYGADGDVIEINLTTVKVQNFDKTITTIPTYALTSDSIKNWRGMQNSGGRRIKRAIYIKQKSISFLTYDQVTSLKKIQLINQYLCSIQEKIDKHNAEKNIDKSLLINGRNLTNFGVFRKYITEYLQQHSALNHNMTLMVRQLAPTPQGIPLEIYAFSKDKKWENYEYIIADIFDHILAAIPHFDLQIFESPTEFSTL